MLDAVRAHLVEQAEMRALGDQEIVHGAKYRAEAVGVCHPPFVIAARGAEVADRLPPAGHFAFEQPAVVGTCQLTKLLAGDAVGFRGVGARNYRAGEGALRSFVNPQKRERIGVGAFKQCSYGLCRWLHRTPQISLAYSPIVRSEENHPTLAMFRIALVRHSAWFSQRLSTSRWAAA